MNDRRFRQAYAVFAMAIAASSAAFAEEKILSGEKFLDNGTIRLGVDLARGGCISYFSPSGRDENVVNNFDLGRQIQMSFYSGPVPFTVGDKKPAAALGAHRLEPDSNRRRLPTRLEDSGVPPR